MALGLRRVAQALAIGLVLCLLALLVWRVVQKNGGGAAGALRRGDHPAAPNFTLSRLDGDGQLELSSLRGKAVVLNFWASWCIPCKKEAPLLEQAARQWQKKGVVVVGVDANDFSGDARKFMRHYAISYPVVHDGAGAWVDDYGLTGLPETFFVRPDGRLRRGAGAVEQGRASNWIGGALVVRRAGLATAALLGALVVAGTAVAAESRPTLRRARDRGDVPDVPYDSRPVLRSSR